MPSSSLFAGALGSIRQVLVRDVRFPTSLHLDGSDALHTSPDYSAAYVTVVTDDGAEGHGLAFTLGRGTEVVVAAVQALIPLVQGRTLASIGQDFAGFYRALSSESQLRWIGPEKGALHLATAAVLNAVWDLFAKLEGKPLWKLLADMTAEELVSCIDFRYITDALSPGEALEMLQQSEPHRAEREQTVLASGYPAYTTSAGWLGYPDHKIRHLCLQAVQAGFNHIKLKVGADMDDDLRRCALVRDVIGYERHLMIDANQRWDVDEAIAKMTEFAVFKPLWIEEPTSPDDVLGHQRIAQAIAPIGVATGEACQNRVIFKQLLQASAIEFCQIDACRLGGVNEVLAVLLMAAKFGVRVCPHAGGVGLCEHVQHLGIFDYLRVSGSMEGRVIEFVDHLHEHFVDPVVVENGCYRAPLLPGYSTTMKTASLAQFAFPGGPEWQTR